MREGGKEGGRGEEGRARGKEGKKKGRKSDYIICVSYFPLLIRILEFSKTLEIISSSPLI